MPSPVDEGVRAELLRGLAAPQLHRLYDYWRARWRGDRLPGRRDIDPLELGFILGNLLLVDVLRDPLRFRYRLNGTTLEDTFRLYGLTGTMVDQHPDPAFRAIALEVYGRMAATGRPFSASRDKILDGRVRHYDSLLLPLAADGVTVDMILGGMWFRSA